MTRAASTAACCSASTARSEVAHRRAASVLLQEVRTDREIVDEAAVHRVAVRLFAHTQNGRGMDGDDYLRAVLECVDLAAERAEGHAAVEDALGASGSQCH